ncbi:helix-turn-helix transcriptional regulator [Modestobacter sp. DSM 44400]|uniref:ArsR/SmtB family transcription factor n=1 Tax=Modestobacter sp. DSM 44400 TaxID=1550230 RepID=UPI0020C90F27|nr:metalloregulator ArsR/SmtB family transcription factor [Modestobacter sp. DSM 44400]
MAAYQARDGWEALGDPTRRAIVACLAERPRAVGELADELPISRPAVSQHLKVLKDAGLVTDRAAGTHRVYRLSPEGLGALHPPGTGSRTSGTSPAATSRAARPRWPLCGGRSRKSWACRWSPLTRSH